MFFFQMPSVNYSEVIVQSRSPFSFVPGGISQGQLSGASCSGGNYSGQDVLVAKVPGEISWAPISQLGNYSGVTVEGEKMRDVLGGIP